MNYENINEIINIFKKIDSEFDFELIKKAYSYAYKMHINQKRKSNEPYIMHPLNVALILAEIFKDTPLIVAALLHDVIEDTPATKEDISEHFGSEIAFLVAGVTKLKSFEKHTDYNKTQIDMRNLQNLLLATIKDARVMLVKLADRLHNMRTLQHKERERQIKIAQETLNLYAPIAALFGIKKIQSELEDLCFKILNYNEYKNIANIIALKKTERDKIIEKTIKKVSEKLSKEITDFKIFGRSKHLYSIYQKKLKKNIRYDDILDLQAIRIIVKTKEECYLATSVIHSMFQKIRADKDYIRKPKKNGYQSIHITVKDKENNKLEFQILTYEMNRFAEIGPAAHWIYKLGKQNANLPKIDKTSYKIDLFEDYIFVFTPMKKIIKLPKGATPIDFAFEIHTQVGLRTKEAKVNGKLVPLKTRLKNADMVEIITSKEINCSRDWKNIVVCKKAKSKINAYFRKKMEEDAISLGKEIFLRRARKFHIPHKSEDDIIKFARKFGLYNLFDFYSALGRGKIVISVKSINKKTNRKTKKETEIQTHQSENISLGLIKNLMINFAKCCNPKPNDEIVGYITRGRGISVHKKNCSNPGFVYLLKNEKDRILEINWDTLNKKKKKNFHKIKIVLKKHQTFPDEFQAFLNKNEILYLKKRIRTKRNLVIYQITFLEITDNEFDRLKEKLKEKFGNMIL